MVSKCARTRVISGAVLIGFVVAVFAGCSSGSSKKAPVAGDAGDAGEAGALDQAGSSGASGTSSGDEAGAAGEAGLGGASAGGISAAGDSAGGAAGTAGSGAQAGDAGASGGDACSAPGTHVLIDFALTDPERVTNLRWQESDSLTTANLAASGGPLVCGDPVEYFGQAYGAEDTLPAPVVAGHVATLVRCGYDALITGADADCSAAAQYPVTTQYHWYSGVQANEVRVTRSFKLTGTPNFPQGILRAYVPRLPASAFSSVMYPNQDNTAITTGSIAGCATDCLVSVGPTWSGRWFADLDPASGRALIVLRDASSTSPARLAGNNDGFSGSNLTSFQLYAVDGWPTTLTETEYLCFADLTTWPQADRDAAKLPAGCGP